MKKLTNFLFLSIFVSQISIAQPKPGDVFREYAWTMPERVGNEAFLRVGGRIDYRMTPEKFPENHLKDGYILMPFEVDLKNAVKAEITLEKVQSHEDTKGLRLSINQHNFQEVPFPLDIPEPRASYFHHSYPTIEMPLNQLKTKDNRFCLKVDTVHPWNWPQNLFYGVILRVYYEKKQHFPAKIIVENNVIGDDTKIKLKTEKPFQKAIVIGKYEGVNLEGDGVYNQWHYNYFKGDVIHTIGEATPENQGINWNTEWIPNQPEPIKLSAWVYSSEGFVYFLPAKEFELKRKHSVELCKPYNQLKKWVTRNGEHTSNFKVIGNLENASEARIIWTSWSPGYMNGLYVNDFLVFVREGPNYMYYVHNVPVTNMKFFNEGENTIKTGMIPKFHGQMVHGMEVQWPGMMVLIKYDN